MSEQTMLGRNRGAFTPVAAAVVLGDPDSGEQLEVAFDADAERLFQKVRPLVDKVLTDISRGKDPKDRSCWFKGTDRDDGKTLCSVSSGLDSGATISLYGYWGGSRVEECVARYYGLYGYRVFGGVATNHLGKEEPSYYNIFIVAKHG